MDTNKPVEKALFLAQEFSNQMAYHLEKADFANRGFDEPIFEQELRSLAKEAQALNEKVMRMGMAWTAIKL